MIDLTGLNYLRWGAYDASSNYKFTGGASLSTPAAIADQHTLSIQVKADTTIVSWDGTQVGTFAAVKSGFVGLVTSQSAIAFDDFTVTAS